MRAWIWIAVALAVEGKGQVFRTIIDTSGSGSIERVAMLHVDTSMAAASRVFASDPAGAEIYLNGNGQVRRAYLSVEDERERIVMEWFDSGQLASVEIDRGNGLKGSLKNWYEDG
ncbi:MAG: hypothetical protein QM724_03750 [Flavobacteriales bacterium]